MVKTFIIVPMRLTPESDDFIWASGIEDTFVVQTRNGHRSMDEYDLIGHYEHWREDLALAATAGVRSLRWGVPWYRVEPVRGDFDWSWTDQVVPYLVDELGITPIVDLMHYGCPLWLDREFANQEYPQAVAAYAGAFARRYRDRVHWYTPVNEPLVTAQMCGQRGLWPPYLRGDAGYVRIMMQVTKGARETVRCLKETDPGATMVHVEAASIHRADRTELEPLAEEDRLKGYLSFDLLEGRVIPGHPLFGWLVRHGAGLGDLAEFARHPTSLDVIGLNFYPQWSTRQLYVNRSGRLSNRSREHDGAGFEALVEQFSERFDAPIMVTETSAVGSESVRSQWLEASVSALKRLRMRGVPVHGYTWFPLCTMYDWRYRFGSAPKERYRIELGLFSLANTDDRERWNPTPLVSQLRGYMKDPASSIGRISTVDGEDI
jgi:beta-glucosidase